MRNWLPFFSKLAYYIFRREIQVNISVVVRLEQYLQQETPEREAQEKPIEYAPLQGWLDRFRGPAYIRIVAASCPQPV
jgi:hypothetical protein